MQLLHPYFNIFYTMEESLFYFSFRYSFEGHLNRIDVSVLVESHPVDTSHPMVACRIVQRTTVVNDVIIFRIRHMYNGMMAGSSRYRRVLLQYLGYPFERTERRICNGISHRIVGAGPAAFAPHEIVFTVLLNMNGPST